MNKAHKEICTGVAFTLIAVSMLIAGSCALSRHNQPVVPVIGDMDCEPPKPVTVRLRMVKADNLITL